ADLHIIMTSQSTGAGGREFQLDFMGREEYAGYELQLFHRSLSTDTEREELDGVTHVLSLGLAQFANFAGFRDLVAIQGTETTGAQPGGLLSAEQVDDPWNLWVFRVGGNGDYEGESTREEVQLRSFVSASRVTPTWKTNLNARVDFQRIEQQRTDGSLFVDERTDWNFGGRLVYSLADRWSIGFSGNTGRNTRRNQDHMFQINPAVEFSFFPYPEATRRALTAFYEVGPVYRNYIEETVLGETAALYAEQAVSIEFSQRQAWGDARIRARWSNYLQNFGQNNLELDGNLSFRITRGLDLNTGASYARVRDQIYLSGEGLTDEERLLELAQEGTDYEASVFLGLSYQFGSIFNNVVNNRFPGGRGF
ncbi:MAG: hypothetical protein R3223_07605, partial [Longimicrobiales bacterium]|nr:hypothetical protein [Longimicrobiales bacterium]